MAVDAFIMFWSNDSNYQPVGETTDDYFSKYSAFEIKDFSFDLENPTTLGSATKGGGGGKAKFTEFNITKPTDSASAIFFRNCCSGMHYKKVVIAIRKAGGDASASGAPFLFFSFGTVFTTKVDWTGPGEEGPEEKISFAYAQFGIRYLPQDAAGMLTSDPKIDVGWDQAKNTLWDEVTASFPTGAGDFPAVPG